MIHIRTFTYDNDERLIDQWTHKNTEDTIQVLADALNTYEEINFIEVACHCIHLTIGHGKTSKVIVIESGFNNSIEMMPIIGFIYWWSSGHAETTRLLARKIANNCELGYGMRFENLSKNSRSQLIANPIMVAIMMTYGFFEITDIEHALQHAKTFDLVTFCALAEEFGVSLQDVEHL